ncbi:MAG: response regulator [Candidatus Tectomicrobia bacterium]
MAAGNILIIEDEERLRANMKVVLGFEGYSVTTAADGNQGVAYLRDASFDLVITDIKMEGLNGFEVMEYIAAHTPHTPVIVMTGYASTTSAVEALRQGAYDYIAKPFEIEIIRFSIERALEKSRLQQEIKGHMQELEQRVAERTRDLNATNRKLNHSLAELKSTQAQLIRTEKLSALGELISGFAHELNNPLSSVLGYAELLAKSDTCSAHDQAMLELIAQEAVRCHQIVKNLLGFARKQKPEKKLIDLNTVCLKVLDLLAYQFKVSGITIVPRLDTHLPHLTVDGHQLQQVFVNVITNAYQAMSEHAEGGRLTLTTASTPDRVTIQIADTGPGITATNLRRIFDPFFTTKEQGTGLGLSLSYGIVQEHGGEISVVSKPGEGTTFTIQLPILTENQPAAEVNTTPIATPMGPQTILVVDDEPTLLQLLVDTLHDLGHQADPASSGQEALQKIASQHYDLILCDLKMPQGDGYQLYQHLQNNHPESVNRLIFSTGDMISEAHLKYLEDSGRPLLIKPFLQEEVQQVIYQAVVERES